MEEQNTQHSQGPLGIRSQEIQELMGKIPGSILRWGASLMLVLVAGVAAGAYYIEWPQVMEVPITLHAVPDPIQYKAEKTARIEEIFCEKGHEVSAGTPLYTLVDQIGTVDTVFALAGGKVSFSSLMIKGVVVQTADLILTIYPAQQSFVGEIDLSGYSDRTIPSGTQVVVDLPDHLGVLAVVLKDRIVNNTEMVRVRFEGASSTKIASDAIIEREFPAKLILGRKTIWERIF